MTAQPYAPAVFALRAIFGRPMLATCAALTLLAPGVLPNAHTLAFAADLAHPAHAAAAPSPAYRALLEGRVDEAQSLLSATLAHNPSDALAHQLLCRVFYSQDQADSAVHECELAAQADPTSSDDQLWLGRAYGLKARHVGPLSAFSLARKVRASFALAVELNPASVSALSDLGQYYIAAPSIVGGGDERARALATRIMPLYPAAAHRLLGFLAESNKDLPTAESEFKLAIAAPRTADSRTLPEAWIDLAQFYQTHNRPDDALAAIKSGLAADRLLPTDRTHGPVLVDAASILTAAQREPDLAERCLRDYVAGRAKSDAAPAFKVHLQLSHLLAARGDSADAGKELASAAALAPAFAAHKAQGS